MDESCQVDASHAESEVEDMMATAILPKLPLPLCQRKARRKAYKSNWKKKKTKKFLLRSISTAMEEIESSEEGEHEQTEQGEAQKIEPRRCPSGIFEESILEDTKIAPVALLKERELHKIQTGNESLLQNAFNANMKLFMEKLNEITSNVNSQVKNIEKLLTKTYQSAHKRSYDDEDDAASSIIRKMASSNPEVRATVNHMQCMEILGFPVTTSREDLKNANHNLSGDEINSKRRRNALVNILNIVAPKIDDGKKTVQTVVRECLYSIAPVYLWQFYSSQGKSGTSKYSFMKELPHIYTAVMVAAIKQSGLNNSAVRSAIGIVIRSCPTRVESIKFRSQHPEQFSDTEKSKTPQGKANARAKGKKRELVRGSCSEDSGQDMPTPSPEEPAKKRQSLYSRQVMAKAISSMETSEEEAESESDDSDNGRYVFG